VYFALHAIHLYYLCILHVHNRPVSSYGVSTALTLVCAFMPFATHIASAHGNSWYFVCGIYVYIALVFRMAYDICYVQNTRRWSWILPVAENEVTPMKAAVVRSFDAPPRYEDFELPSAGADEVVVRVLAAGLHQRVRSGASGSHYAELPMLPMIPGIDAVGRLPDGQLAYCVVHDTPYGTMAEQVIVDRHLCVPLPDGTDAAIVAAAMNPAMSSWIALRLRAPIEQGQSVFVLGATGSAGRMAIPIAKLLGAARVVAAGRQIARLESSGADEVVSLIGEPQSVAEAIGKAAGESDIVLDYLWGKPAADAMVAVLAGRRDRGRRINWIQIGAVAGPTMALPSVAIRSTNLCVMGSGQGSVPTKAIAAELPRLAAEVLAASIPVNVLRVPLSQVEQAWNAPASPGQRIVFVP
jgi:NADPH:quinone reductase-like Zn-dependent oxidoreductase